MSFQKQNFLKRTRRREDCGARRSEHCIPVPGGAPGGVTQCGEVGCKDGSLGRDPQ